MPYGPIMDTLMRSGRLDLKQVDSLPADPDKPPEQALLEAGVLSTSDVLAALNQVYNVPAVCLADENIEPDAHTLIPYDMAVNCSVLPLRREGDRIVLAMADPSDVVAEDFVRFATGCDIIRLAAMSWELKKTTEKLYKVNVGHALDLVQDDLLQHLDVVTDADEEEEGKDDEAAINSAPVVRAVHELLQEAFIQKASDIHFEPVETGLRVRFRIDGYLKEITELPRLVQPMVLSRLKLTSGMDISEKRRPQDGRTRIRAGDREIDFRVSSLPTFYGEKIVLRILDNKKAKVDLEVMGMSERDLACFLDFIRMPQGMILITGPTGSGKTSTLYAALSRIHTPDTNIVTVEDPVEFQISGINQVQVNNKAGLTFANALRSILRQDPNVVMLGEIRDLETATIALEAAMTGHLVLSTLHTNDAPSAVSRLIHLGVPNYLVASCLLGVMAQRLVRKVCQNCKSECPASPEMLDILGRSGLQMEIPDRFFTGSGCRDCKNSGFTGRMGIFEILRMTEQFKALIYGEATEQEMRALARRQGMNTLLEDGIRKCEAGLTSLEEVLKVAPAGTEVGGDTGTAEFEAGPPVTQVMSGPAARGNGGHGGRSGHGKSGVHASQATVVTPSSSRPPLGDAGPDWDMPGMIPTPPPAGDIECSCGFLNPPSTATCLVCGLILPATGGATPPPSRQSSQPDVGTETAEGWSGGVPTTITCPCGTVNGINQHFCKGCGQPSATLSGESIVCPCGAVHPPSQRFCHDCGSPLSGASLTSAVLSAVIACTCGAVHPATQTFCQNCGASLHGGGTPAWSPYAQPRQGPIPRPGSAPRAPRERILVIDDDPDLLNFVRRVLELEFFEVLLAHDPQEGLSLAFTSSPSVIILDVAMPGMTGLAVCRKLRKHVATRSIPILMLTGLSGIEDEGAGFEAGADDYIAKPVNPAKLVARVEASLRRVREHR